MDQLGAITEILSLATGMFTGILWGKLIKLPAENFGLRGIFAIFRIVLLAAMIMAIRSVGLKPYVWAVGFVPAMIWAVLRVPEAGSRAAGRGQDGKSGDGTKSLRPW